MSSAVALAVAVLLAGCTVIHIEGDGNSVSDAGGHGGGTPRTLAPFGTPQAAPDAP
jgi:hypothetical protein